MNLVLKYVPIYDYSDASSNRGKSNTVAVDAEDCFLEAYVHIVGRPFKKG